MKILIKWMLSLLIIGGTVFGMLTVWRNCSLTTYGEEPVFDIAVEDSGERVLLLGEAAVSLPLPEKLLGNRLFQSYPALMPRSLRLVGAAAAEWESIRQFFLERQEDFLHQLTG